MTCNRVWECAKQQRVFSVSRVVAIRLDEKTASIFLNLYFEDSQDVD